MRIRKWETIGTGLVKEIEKECSSYQIEELALSAGTHCDKKIREVGEELGKACFGEDFVDGFERVTFMAQYEGVYAYSYDPEASYEALQQGKAHLEKADDLLPGKIPRKKVPGFNAIAAIAGLLFAVYLISRRKKNKTLSVKEFRK